MSLDDLMKLESFGRARIDPRGRWLIYERVRPYKDITDYSFRTYAQRFSGHQLWRVNLEKQSQPELLPGIDPDPSTYMDSFSATGRYLSVFQYHFGKFALGAYDTEKKKVRYFEETPAYARTGEFKPAWVSDHEMVYVGHPPGEQPLATSLRAHAASVITQAWADAWRGDTVTAQEISPESSEPTEHADGRLVLADARTGRTRILSDRLFADLRVSPDRRKLAALTVSGTQKDPPDHRMQGIDRAYQLAIVDLKSGEVHALAPNLEFLPLTLSWSPDSKQIAGYGWPYGESFRNGRFYTVDVSNGSVHKYDHTGLDLVAEQERGWFHRPERVSFLGDSLAVYARKIPSEEDQSPRFTYHDQALSSSSEANWYALAPNGTSINLTSNVRHVRGVPFYADEEGFAVAAADGVYKVSAQGDARRITPVLSAPPQFVFPTSFGLPGSLIRANYENEVLLSVKIGTDLYALILRFDRNASIISRLVKYPDPTAKPVSGSIRTGKVLFESVDGGVSELHLAGSKKDSIRRVAIANTHLRNRNFGSWKEVSYSILDPKDASRTARVQSCILLPPTFNASAPPPLVVDIYPNASPRCSSNEPEFPFPNPHSPYLWAARGFAYARLPAPKDFIRTDDGPIAGISEVIDNGINWLVENDLADPERIVLYGFSQGGVAALYAAAHSNLYTAVIAKNSWSNFYSHYFGGQGILSHAFIDYLGHGYSRYDTRDYGSFAIGRTPFDDPDVYHRNSPVFLAPGITSPVLLIHTDMDTFSQSHFDEMYGALSRVGRSVRYVRYIGEGHVISSPANIYDMWERIDRFLAENLGSEVAYGAE